MTDQQGMAEVEYLLSYGLTGEFGRFRTARPLECRRGDRVVVRTHRGVEMARVLRQATPRHAHYLPNTTVGQLLRVAVPEDEQQQADLRQRAQELFERGRALAAELDLPLELLDVEVLLDGEHAVLHQLRWAECDVRPFVSTLSREFGLHLALEDLAHDRPAASEEEEEELAHGCGREGCGSEGGGGGCSSCGSGGCSTCGMGAAETQAYFAQLREQMESRRTNLL
jgi:hypothetical protein